MVKNKQKHLPVFGIGPILCIPMAVVSAIAIWLSAKGMIPYIISDKFIIKIFRIIGVLLITEGILCFLGAALNGSFIKNVKSNQLKTNGSYAFVRNPCYALYFLGSTGALLLAQNPVLLVLPLLFWFEMTVVLKNTEEKWLKDLYGQEYLDYCKKVNRCILWFPKK